MRTITLEEHITTPALEHAIDSVGRRGAPSEYVKRIQTKLLDVGQGRLADMDAGKIGVQVLSVAGFDMDRLESSMATTLARECNDAMAENMRAHPDRFGAFACLNLREPEIAARELERCINQLRFHGVMVHGTTDELFLDNPRFAPFWEAAESLDAPVYLHPAPPPVCVQQGYFGGLPDNVAFFLSTAAWGWHAETGLHVLRLIASGVFDRHPRLQVIIGHMGENLPFSLARADYILSRLRPPLPRRVTEYFHDHIHITTSGYFSLPPFLCTLQVAGADRILFSVDYPYATTEQGRAFLDALPISPTDLGKIAHGNAEKLLKIAPIS
jgi:predicted TIM-barrel fold metal-dependent hydrolase